MLYSISNNFNSIIKVHLPSNEKANIEFTTKLYNEVQAKNSSLVVRNFAAFIENVPNITPPLI